MTMKVSEEAVESVSLKDKRNDIARSQPCLSGIYERKNTQASRRSDRKDALVARAHLMEIMCTCAS